MTVRQQPETEPGSGGIHPTAVVAPGAQFGPGVTIGPFAVIANDVTIGANTHIGPHAVIERGTRIGRENEIGAGALIGCLPQDRAFLKEESYVVIGDRNQIREYVSISRATGAGESTTIGDENFIMSYARLDHNCRIGNRVVLVGGMMVGGHVQVEDEAYLGGLSGVHQFVRVGRLAMVGAYSFLRQDVPPFMLATGTPARCRGLNLVGLRRRGVPPGERARLRRAFHILYQSRLPMTRAVDAIAEELGEAPMIQELVTFLQSSQQRSRGIIRWSRTEEP